MKVPADPAAESAHDLTKVDVLMNRARRAQREFEKDADQTRYDQAALAAAWALMEPERNRELATMAVETTGLGNVGDKIAKNHRKTLGLLRDIRHARTCGVIEEDARTGITKIARPKGVVGAMVPSTNPVATPVNNVVNALKCGNAIILSPSPSGAKVCESLVGHIHAEFGKVGLERNLVQMIPAPITKASAQRLMEAVDVLVVTGSQDNVRRAYRSGTPAVGVGQGNVTVIVDETADLPDAAEKIRRSKTFDHATSCSSENCIIAVDGIYDDFVAELDRCGGRLLKGQAAHRLKRALFGEGGLNRAMLAKDLGRVTAVAGIDVPDAATAEFLLVEGTGVGPEHRESGEKLSLVAALYRARDFAEAKELAAGILAYQGAGHSIGLHSAADGRAVELGMTLPTCRVIVNQAHCFATGGSFDNGMPFSLSMGCGSWGGNSIDDNFHYRHLLNITKVVRTIPVDEPCLEDMFHDYWEIAGK